MFLFNTATFFLLIFLIMYLTDKRRLTNVIFLLIGLGFLLISIVLGLINIGKSFIALILIMLVFLFILVIPIIFFGVGVALIYNSLVLIKHEGRRLRNLLSLLVGLAIIAILLFIAVSPILIGYGTIKIGLFVGITLISFYFLFVFIIFFMSSLIYNLNRPIHNKDFILILGCGLIGDRVPPLLASRIDRGIKFYYEQKQIKNRVTPKLVVCGGQGADELMSEAEAMKLYLIDNGVAEEDIILEDKSTTTYENMKFAKQKMDSIKSKYKCIFVTNNFHLFRAGIYAKKAKLKCDGIGSKTALYYLPNAFIREYFAILVMHKKFNIAIVGIIMLLSILTILFVK